MRFLAMDFRYEKSVYHIDQIIFLFQIVIFGDKMKLESPSQYALVTRVKSAFFLSVPDSMKIVAARYLNVNNMILFILVHMWDLNLWP
jgi:hypothetical protein